RRPGPSPGFRPPPANRGPPLGGPFFFLAEPRRSARDRGHRFEDEPADRQERGDRADHRRAFADADTEMPLVVLHEAVELGLNRLVGSQHPDVEMAAVPEESKDELRLRVRHVRVANEEVGDLVASEACGGVHGFFLSWRWVVDAEAPQIAERRCCGTGRRSLLAIFASSRSSARARRNSRPSSLSNRSFDEKNMNPPGTRTAIPTVRRSNSTAKRWVGT